MNHYLVDAKKKFLEVVYNLYQVRKDIKSIHKGLEEYPKLVMKVFTKEQVLPMYPL